MSFAKRVVALVGRSSGNEGAGQRATAPSQCPCCTETLRNGKCLNCAGTFDGRPCLCQR